MKTAKEEIADFVNKRLHENAEDLKTCRNEEALLSMIESQKKSFEMAFIHHPRRAELSDIEFGQIVSQTVTLFMNQFGGGNGPSTPFTMN